MRKKELNLKKRRKTIVELTKEIVEEYFDKNNYRYSYVEVWRVADRTKDYFEDLHAEWDGLE